jgi:hypothetical protein
MSVAVEGACYTTIYKIVLGMRERSYIGLEK